MRKQPYGRSRLRTSFLASLSLLLSICGTQGARSETERVRIAQQFGIAYLPLIVSSERGFIEEEARNLGIKPPIIEWLRLSGAAAMNEALISGGARFRHCRNHSHDFDLGQDAYNCQDNRDRSAWFDGQCTDDEQSQDQDNCGLHCERSYRVALCEGWLPTHPAPDGCGQGVRPIRQTRRSDRQYAPSGCDSCHPVRKIGNYSAFHLTPSFNSSSRAARFIRS